ncbi:hypothetical protein FDUTEX481_09663 [Tolypothrix sp. PCC 7601]|nr:hypothetical protein FDUTEX481_09663 [Tolypothrix sp. PCC 7601]
MLTEYNILVVRGITHLHNLLLSHFVKQLPNTSDIRGYKRVVRSP